LGDVGYKLEDMGLPWVIRGLGGLDYFFNLLLSWHAAQKPEDVAHIPGINILIAMRVKDAKCLRNLSLKFVI